MMVSMGLFESWATTVSKEATKLFLIMKSALRSLGSTLDSCAEHKATKEPKQSFFQNWKCQHQAEDTTSFLFFQPR
jgi:hypothetical protein